MRNLAVILGPNALSVGDYYNQLAFKGLVAARDESRFDFDVLIAPDANQIRYVLDSCCATNHYDLILAIGSIMQEKLATCARSNADRKFALLDGFVQNLPNVLSHASDPRDISFLCGRIAASLSDAKVTGCILWSDNWIAREWVDGYTIGAKSVDPNIKVAFDFASDQNSACIRADSQFQEGVDIIMCHAGQADLGIIHSARNHRKHVIGFLNGRQIDKDHVLFDVTRDVGPQIRDILHRLEKNDFGPNRLIKFGLRQGSFDIDISDMHSLITSEKKQMITKTITKIKNGSFDSLISNENI